MHSCRSTQPFTGPPHRWRSVRRSAYALKQRCPGDLSSHRTRWTAVRSTNPDTETEVQQEKATEVQPDVLQRSVKERSTRRRQADSTDWVSSQLTRRFGIAGGLLWLGVLAFGVISEQVKTRLEDSAERQNTKDVKEERVITTRSGLKYVDKRIGGGAPVQPGLLLVLEYRAWARGQLFEDTKERGKPIVFTYDARPFTGGMCRGAEEALGTMRAGGVRMAIVPPELGFGEEGFVLRPTEHVPEKQGLVPPGATLEYELSVLRVSIAPS